jgi:hypothetical protein
MRITPCTWLAKNAELYLRKLDKRNGMAGRPSTDSDLRFAEYELIRLTRIIIKHRRSCGKCRLNFSALAAEQRTFRPLSSEISPSRLIH